MSEKLEQISPEFRESEKETQYREIREEFVKRTLGGETPGEEFIKRMKNTAKELGARADMINEDVAKQHMTPDQREATEKRKSELYQASADKAREDIKRWQEDK